MSDARPTVAYLDELTTRVLAPNPSPMTLEGTNSYLVGAPKSGEVLVVDPGPDRTSHRRAIEAAVDEADAEVVGVVLTHHHRDHAEAAGWAEQWGVPLWAFNPGLLEGVEAAAIGNGAVVERAGVGLEAVHTPGHSSDHLCLRVAGTDAVLTGDHVLGRGTTVVLWPDGDMADYLESLRRLAGLAPAVLYPGHGPVVEDPASLVEEYLSHRRQREQEVLEALAAGDRTAAEIVARVYADVDPALHPAAERSVRAHLEKLLAEGAVRRHRDDHEEAFERG